MARSVFLPCVLQRQAAAAPKALVEVAIVRAHDRELGITVHVDLPPALTLRESVDVLVAVAEDNLLSKADAVRMEAER